MVQKKLHIAKITLIKKPEGNIKYKPFNVKFLVFASKYGDIKPAVEKSLESFLKEHNAEIKKIETTYITYDGLIDADTKSQIENHKS